MNDQQPGAPLPAPFLDRKGWDLLFVFCISFVSIIWFRGDWLVNPGDTNFCFFPINDLIRSLFQWDHQQGLGLADSMATAKVFPFHSLMALLQYAGLDLYLSQKVLFFLMFFLSGISITFLINEIWGVGDRNVFSRWSGISFYMMNSYLLQKRWGGGNLMTLFFHAVFPLMVFFWWKARKSPGINNLVALVLVSLLALPTLNNPAYLTPFLLFVVVDFFFCWGVRRDGSFLVLGRNALISLGLSIPLFLFYISAIYTTVGASLVNLAKSSGEFQQYHLTSATTSFLNLFRFLGDWSFFENHLGDLYYPYSPIYNTPLFILMGLGITAIGLIGTMAIRENNKEKNLNSFFFVVLFLFGLWLMKGVHRPFGFLMEWCFNRVPAFSMFRDPMDKFGELIVLSFSVLLVRGLHNLSSRFKGFARVIFPAVFLLTLQIYAWPFWTGDIWGTRVPPRVLSERRFRIPPSYVEFAHYINALPGKARRILMVPDIGASVPGILSVRLGGSLYTGADPLGRLITRPILYLCPFSYGNSDMLTQILYDDFSEDIPNFIKNVGALTKIVDADSILWRGDVDNTTYPRIVSPLALKNYLEHYPLERKVGNLELYSLPPGVDSFYRLRSAWLWEETNSSPSSIWPIVQNEKFFPKDGVFFPGDNPATQFLEEELVKQWTPSWEKVSVLHSNRLTEGRFFCGESLLGDALIQFDYVNPTQFNIRVREAKGAFPIVFTESFHPGWNLLVVPQGPEWRKKTRLSKFLSAAFPFRVKGENALNVSELNKAIDRSLLPNRVGALEWPHSLHWKVNTYANVWWLDEKLVERIDREGRYFRKSPDGKIDFEAVVEFAPQKTGWVSAWVSGMSAILYLVFLLASGVQSRLKKKS